MLLTEGVDELHAGALFGLLWLVVCEEVFCLVRVVVPLDSPRGAEGPQGPLGHSRGLRGWNTRS